MLTHTLRVTSQQSAAYPTVCSYHTDTVYSCILVFALTQLPSSVQESGNFNLIFRASREENLRQSQPTRAAILSTRKTITATPTCKSNSPPCARSHLFPRCDRTSRLRHMTARSALACSWASVRSVLYTSHRFSRNFAQTCIEPIFFK